MTMKTRQTKTYGTAKTVLRGKFIAYNPEQSQINNLTLHLKQLEKQEQKKCQS